MTLGNEPAPSPAPSTRAPHPGVPRALLWFILLCLVAGVAVTFAGAWRIGVYLDEGYHVERYNNYQQMGWYLPTFELTPDLSAPAPSSAHDYVYGPASMILLHGFVALTGTEPWSHATMTPDAIALRHIGVALIATLGLVEIILLGRMITRSWRWGLVAGGLLALTPVWTGLSMMNVKDVPVAVGFTTFTLGLALVLRGAQTSRLPVWVGPLTIAAGIVLAAGTRLGIWPGLAASAAGALALSWYRRSGRAAPTWGPAPGSVGLRIAAGVLAGGAGLVAIYPVVLRSPIQALIGSVSESANFLIGASTPRGYIPALVLLEMPVVMVVLSGIALVWLVRVAAERRGELDFAVATTTLVVLQMLVVPVLAVIKGSDLYDGLRQILFAVPPVAILAMVGMRSITGFASRQSRGVRGSIHAAVIAGLLLPMLSQIQLFPYTYTYYNALVAVSGVHNETDYWRTSFQDLVPSLPASVPVTCYPTVVDNRTTRVSFDGVNDCATDPLLPVFPYADRRAPGPPAGFGAEDFYALVPGTDAATDNCLPVATVTRRLLWSVVPMSALVRCHLAYPTYPPGGFRIGTTVQSLAPLVLGWSQPAEPGGVWTSGSEAILAFHVPTGMLGQSLAVSGSIRATVDATVTATWHGRNSPSVATTQIQSSAESFHLAVPQADSGLLFVTFKSADGGPLGLRVSSVMVTPEH